MEDAIAPITHGQPDAVTVWPVDAVPRIAVSAPPELPQESRQCIERERTRFAADGTHVDGPVLMATAASPTAITAFKATYAWHVADRRSPLPGVVGAVGVQVAIAGPEGVLWQQRGPGVDAPGVWSISAAGALPPSATCEAHVLEEAREELGIDPRDLTDLRPLAVIVGRHRRLVEVVFRARLRHGRVPRPDGREVVGVRWASDPTHLPGRLDPLTAGWSERLLRLL